MAQVIAKVARAKQPPSRYAASFESKFFLFLNGYQAIAHSLELLSQKFKSDKN